MTLKLFVVEMPWQIIRICNPLTCTVKTFRQMTSNQRVKCLLEKAKKLNLITYFNLIILTMDVLTMRANLSFLCVDIISNH